MQRLATLRTIATIAVVVTCIILGMCTVRREPVPVPPPVRIEPVVVPALPPPPAPVVVPAPVPPAAPEPVPVVLDIPAPDVEAEPPPPVLAPPALPVAAPAVVPPAPVDEQIARRAAIRKRLELDGYRYGGKAKGAWPPDLLEAEVERRLRAGE